MRTLTFSMPSGIQVLVEIWEDNRVTVAERHAPDHSITWGPPVNPVHDTADDHFEIRERPFAQDAVDRADERLAEVLREALKSAKEIGP